jgi:hypothetical protein
VAHALLKGMGQARGQCSSIPGVRKVAPPPGLAAHTVYFRTGLSSEPKCSTPPI